MNQFAPSINLFVQLWIMGNILNIKVKYQNRVLIQNIWFPDYSLNFMPKIPTFDLSLVLDFCFLNERIFLLAKQKFSCHVLLNHFEFFILDLNLFEIFHLLNNIWIRSATCRQNISLIKGIVLDDISFLLFSINFLPRKT